MTGGSGPRGGWYSASCGYSEMFGYVLPPMELLPEEERRRFRSVYCGLCRCLGQRCGQGALTANDGDLRRSVLGQRGGQLGKAILANGVIAHSNGAHGNLLSFDKVLSGILLQEKVCVREKFRTYKTSVEGFSLARTVLPYSA